MCVHLLTFGVAVADEKQSGEVCMTQWTMGELNLIREMGGTKPHIITFYVILIVIIIIIIIKTKVAAQYYVAVLACMACNQMSLTSAVLWMSLLVCAMNFFFWKVCLLRRLRFPTVAFRCILRQITFTIFDLLPTTCLRSANQQYVQLIPVVSVVKSSKLSVKEALFQTT